MACLNLVGLLYFPVACFQAINNPKVNIQRDEKYEETYGALYEETKVDTFFNLNFTVALLCRRFMFISSLIVFAELPIVQNVVTTITNLGVVVAIIKF